MNGETVALPEDLQALVLRARRAAAEAAVADANLAYALSLLAQAATGRSVPAGRGGAVETCARALGYSRQKLQLYGVIARRWTAEQFSALVKRGALAGGRLSVSHLLLIAALPRSARDVWIERVLEQGISAHALKERLQEFTGRHRGARRGQGFVPSRLANDVREGPGD
jgi:hypothetical protein